MKWNRIVFNEVLRFGGTVNMCVCICTNGQVGNSEKGGFCLIPTSQSYHSKVFKSLLHLPRNSIQNNQLFII